MCAVYLHLCSSEMRVPMDVLSVHECGVPPPVFLGDPRAYAMFADEADGASTDPVPHHVPRFSRLPEAEHAAVFSKGSVGIAVCRFLEGFEMISVII